METLTKKLKTFLTTNELKPGLKNTMRAEICFCQGYIAALPEGEEKNSLASICSVFHFAGRSIL
jgi:hypothetical protein